VAGPDLGLPSAAHEPAHLLLDVVGLRPDDHLHRLAHLQHAHGARGLELPLVQPGRILQLDPEPRDARLQGDDVVLAAEPRQDLLRLRHDEPPLRPATVYACAGAETPGSASARSPSPTSWSRLSGSRPGVFRSMRWIRARNTV